MTSPSPWPRRFLVIVLVLEASGGLLVALINLAVSDFLGEEVLAPQAALLPGGFALLCIVAAVGISQRRTWGNVSAGIIQVAVLVAGFLGYYYSGDPILFVAVGIGLLGVLLLWSIRTGQRPR